MKAAAAAGSEIVGDSSITAVIRPTKLSAPMTDTVVEPTPVLAEASTVLPPLFSSSSYDDEDNSSRLFDPVESTASEPTPPLPDDINNLVPNLIEDDEEKKVRNQPFTFARLDIFEDAGRVCHGVCKQT